MDVDKARKIGFEIIKLLDLNVKENGRVDTDGGDKTPVGLALTVKRIFDEAAQAGNTENINITIAQRSHATNYPTRFEIEVDGKKTRTVHRVQDIRPKPWLVSTPFNLKGGYSYVRGETALASALKDVLEDDWMKNRDFKQA
jgi:hypothetical protein